MVLRALSRLLVPAFTVTALILPASTHGVRADSGSPQPTATATITPVVSPDFTNTPTPTDIPTPTDTPTATPRPRSTPVHATVVPQRDRHHHGKSTGSHATAAPTPRPRATPESTSTRSGRHRKSKRHAHAKPTPTPTATPSMDLNAEDSVAPVICNGKPKGPASKPFLAPPYHGFTSIVSYVDHDLPNFVRDGLVVIANGLQAAPDAIHSRKDFPAYWNPSLRQYVFYDGHNGYDYNVSYQPLYAAASGKVIFAAAEYPDALDHGYGLMVMIDQRNGYVTLYGHMSTILVKKGQKVRRGQKIGISGNTGHSTGPHVHFTVFHNCTPTDPYGWTGGGSDPMQGYQGESSVYLWKTAPLVTNPAPDWPGLGALRAPDSERIVLLKLPPSAGGTAGFTAALHSEAESLAARLDATGGAARIDMLRGAVLVTGPVTARTIYSLPNVASISTPDTIVGAKADLLSALAAAALVSRHPEVTLDRAHHWTGFLLRWAGTTLLLGRGEKGTDANLRLATGRGGPETHHVSTDPRTGAYVIDLGPLTASQYAQLQKHLVQRGRHSSPVSVQPIRHQGAAPAAKGRDSSTWLVALICAIAILGGIGISWLVVRRPAGHSLAS